MNNLAPLLFTKEEPKLFNVVYRKFRPLLVNYAIEYVSNTADAEDLVTDVFIRFLDKPRSFNNLVAVRAFLYTSVYHACINWSIKKSRKDKNQESLRVYLANEWEDYALSRLISQEGANELFQAVQSISAQSRQVCKMLYYDGLTLSEIAQQMRLSKNTVKNHQARGLKILRAHFAKDRP
jgi:RNA polymerase sigma-70 factor (ECF subfamily)